MASPDRIEALWQHPLRPFVRNFVDSPIETSDFFAKLYAGTATDVKPGVIIAQQVIEEADIVRQFTRIQVPSFPYDLIFKFMAMPAVNLRWADEFGKGDKKDIMDMIRANARDDGRILSVSEEVETFDDLSDQAQLLEGDNTGRAFIDNFEAKIPELLTMEYFNYPTSVREDLLRFGVDRFRNYLNVLGRIPLL